MTAGQYTAARITSMTGRPITRTSTSISFHVDWQWNFIGMPLSVPTRKTTPASRSCAILRFRVGFLSGVSRV